MMTHLGNRLIEDKFICYRYLKNGRTINYSIVKLSSFGDLNVVHDSTEIQHTIMSITILFHDEYLLEKYITTVFRKLSTLNSLSIDSDSSDGIVITVDGESYILKNNIIFDIIDDKLMINESLTNKHILFMVKNFIRYDFGLSYSFILAVNYYFCG
jgi:hypothetical protein